MKYGTVTFGQVEAFINKLGGQEVFERLLTYNSFNVTFSDVNAKVMATDPVTSVWKTITIGNVQRDELMSTLKARGMNAMDWLADIIQQDEFTVVDKEEQVDLVNISVAELGFDRATRYDAICARAEELGLKLCPSEVGPQLRLQYLDQPRNERLHVAMEAIYDLDGDWNILNTEHDAVGFWLREDCGNPDHCWRPDDRFIFRKPAIDVEKMAQELRDAAVHISQI